MEDNKPTNHIMLDVTDATECAVPKERYRLENYTFMQNAPFTDIVHTEAPFLHFQVLLPKSEEQRAKAIEYFNQNNKLYVTYINRPEILLYLGCTESVYIRSKTTGVETDVVQNALGEVGHWFRFYGGDGNKL